MRPIFRGLAIAVLQCLIVLSLAGKYAIERERLPRAWVRTLPVDPNLPIRGRYVSLRLELDPPDSQSGSPSEVGGPVQLLARNGRLVATRVASGAEMMIPGDGHRGPSLNPPVDFFIPEHVADPSRRAPGEELWVEVSVPPKGPPRPLRLGVKKDGVLTPLELH